MLYLHLEFLERLQFPSDLPFEGEKIEIMRKVMTKIIKKVLNEIDFFKTQMFFKETSGSEIKVETDFILSSFISSKKNIRLYQYPVKRMVSVGILCDMFIHLFHI